MRLSLAVLAASVLAATALGRPSGTDTGLCPFPLEVQVVTSGMPHANTAFLDFVLQGPVRILLRNETTGRTRVLDSSGSYSVDSKTGDVGFRGHDLWYWALGQVPFLVTDGAGRFVAPRFTLAPGSSRARVLDPCALVAPAPPPLRPRATPAPWPPPAYALSRIAAAHLLPVLGGLVRHDHVHLDVVVDGRRVVVPAGIGLAEPVDDGPCRPATIGDCGAGDFYTARVAVSPLHTHSASGIIHIESDRHAVYTLGQFFDEWGVRLTGRCLGGYCAGGGKELRVYVNGRLAAGDPRAIVLGNRQEIAVVYGRPPFRSVPATYTGGWPGAGCGGPGDRLRC